MMSKENRKKLKEIYKAEYKKAEELEKISVLNREIERIKAKARVDVKRKYQPKTQNMKKHGKDLAKKSESLGRKMAAYSKRQQKFDPLHIDY